MYMSKYNELVYEGRSDDGGARQKSPGRNRVRAAALAYRTVND